MNLSLVILGQYLLQKAQVTKGQIQACLREEERSYVQANGPKVWRSRLGLDTITSSLPLGLWYTLVHNLGGIEIKESAKMDQCFPKTQAHAVVFGRRLPKTTLDL